MTEVQKDSAIFAPYYPEVQGMGQTENICIF